MKKYVYYIEQLNPLSWFFCIWPLILSHGVRDGTSKRRIYYIDGTRLGIWIARRTMRWAGIPVDRLDFRIHDLRDESGTLILLRLLYHDFAEVEKTIIENAGFKEILGSSGETGRLAVYLRKRITHGSYTAPTLWRALLLIRVAAWNRMKEQDGATGILFLNRMIWLREMESYASRHGVEIVAVKNHIKQWMIEISFALDGMKSWLLDRVRKTSANIDPAVGSPQIAVEHYGHLNLSHPECLSDLPFWHHSKISGENILLIFHPWEPLDEEKWKEMSEHGISAIALDPRATRITSVPVFCRRSGRPNFKFPELAASDPTGREERRWLRRQWAYFESDVEYWFHIIKRCNIKVYLGWHKYDAAHCAKAAGMARAGGIMAIYQRAFEESPSPLTTVAADVVFTFSQKSSELERRSGSMISYHVTIGYLADYRFPMLRKMAQDIARPLKQHGAETIIAYFDENSRDDPRWYANHTDMQKNYLFLIEKVLTDPRLGLILKPKVPRTLRTRLGNVLDILQKAEKTGRCLVIEGGAIQSSYPPSLAALASDVAIHGHLYSATAGFESALAGVPTVLLDREGWPDHSLYQLGRGRVVFTDWDELWRACMEHRDRPHATDGFGDWSPLLPALDPFRDGRAAERMATFLKWLIDGFKAGRSKDAIMADAAERYCREWGRDKVSDLRRL